MFKVTSERKFWNAGIPNSGIQKPKIEPQRRKGRKENIFFRIGTNDSEKISPFTFSLSPYT
jgi:hypothetical protein